ncbi:MAG: uL15 family ribosomal protein [Candidatus Methanomethylophilaceae archaeon]|nr:uL15 family ribosomal protein [Candidatus Methanomethylophilaceae archaeon]MBP5394945.1 uL15 family ribosomal protein [Candidatus Methanomethylophilaceae archaeon]
MPSRTKKFRGLRTHGRGKKSGRGAGIIGGHGQAGLGKTKKIYMLKYDRNHFGHHGFTRPPSQVEHKNTINVSELSEQVDRFVELGFGSKDGDAYSIDLTAAGIDKLLGSGSIAFKVNVSVYEASAKAVEKIEAAGGSVDSGDDFSETTEEE